MKPSINRLQSYKFPDQTALTAFTNFLNVLKTCSKFLRSDISLHPDRGSPNFNRLSFIKFNHKLEGTLIKNHSNTSKRNVLCKNLLSHFSPRLCFDSNGVKFDKDFRSQKWNRLKFLKKVDIKYIEIRFQCVSYYPFSMFYLFFCCTTKEKEIQEQKKYKTT